MTAKRMVWAVLPVMALLLTGCPKKAPEPQPTEIEMDTKPIEEPAPEPVEPPPAPVVEDEQEVDPLESGDLRAINEEAARRGFSPNVYFEFDQSSLSTEAREALARNAAFLKEYPNFTLTIEGHCDERGTNEYNLALGERRANTVSNYLSSLGIGANRMRTITYGEERPVCTVTDEACWARNRRGHMVITGS